MENIKDQLKLWDLEREASNHLVRADHYARRGMLEAASAEQIRADLVFARLDQLRRDLSR